MADEYINRQPSDLRGYGLQANLLASADDRPGAAKALAQAASLAPTPEWTLRYVQAIFANSQHDEAYSIAESWLKENPQSHGFRYQLGKLYLAQNKIDRAVQHYTRLADQQVANSETLNNLVWALYQEDKPQALDYAEQAVAADASNPNSVDTLAWILIDSDRDPQRGATLLSDLKNLPADVYPTVQYHLAVGLKRLGNFREAADILARITTGQYQFADKQAASELLSHLRTLPTKNL